MIEDREDLECACKPFEAQVATMQARVTMLRELASRRLAKAVKDGEE